MSDTDHGTPFYKHSSDPIDEWSRSVFEAYRDWPLASTGRWFRTDGGSLLLRIEQFEGMRLEPLFAVELDTANDQIIVDFGSWCASLSALSSSGRIAPHPAVRARKLTEEWLTGDLKLASYSDSTGWRGSKIVDGGETPYAIEPAPVAIGAGGVVIIKSPWRRDWRSWRHTGNGVWVECEVAES